MAGSSSHWGHRLSQEHLEAGYWPETLYSVHTFEPGPPEALSSEQLPSPAVHFAGVEVPEVIKDLCRRASYISQEKLW